MQVGDIFYSVMQKDNCPFEKPRITKFIVDKIYNENCTHPIVATKTDKWGRHYCFKESQVYSTYEDAIPEKNEKLEKIKQWEKERVEWSLKVAEEQRKREDLEKNQIAIDSLLELVNYINENEFPCYEAGSECCYSGQLIGHIYGKIAKLKGEDIK